MTLRDKSLLRLRQRRWWRFLSFDCGEEHQDDHHHRQCRRDSGRPSFSVSTFQPDSICRNGDRDEYGQGRNEKENLHSCAIRSPTFEREHGRVPQPTTQLQ